MRSRTRTGFTLIELMVAMALTMFLMIILTQCFVLALETFNGMKGIGDMVMNLRSAMTLIRSDLAEDHCEGKRRLSDPYFSRSDYPPQAGYFAVKQGSAVVSVTAATAATPYVWEGDPSGGVAPTPLSSYRATDHVLAFTVKRKGNQPQNFFTTALHGNAAQLRQFFYPAGANNNSKSTAYNMLSQPNLLNAANFPPAVPPPGYVGPPSFTIPTPDLPNTTFTPAYPYNGGGTIGFYSSQWAEVYYYLVRTGSTEEPNNAASTMGTPTYALFRAQFVMVPDSTYVNSVNIPNAAQLDFQGLSYTPTGNGGATILFNSPTDAAYVPIRRALNINQPLASLLADPRLIKGTSEGVAGAQQEGSTEMALPNVISFQVQILDTNTNPLAFGDVPTAAPFGGFWDSTQLSQYNQVNNNSLVVSIKAVCITLRVWDYKTRQTRQVSIVQDL